MKQSSARPRLSKLSGFTLVELLVVIAIIAILAAALTVASGVAIKAARRAQAANLANQIQTAVLGYYTEYSVYPVPSGTTTDTLIGDTQSADGASWAALLYCLSGNISPSTGLASPVPSTPVSNTRGIAFLSLKSSDVFTSTTLTPNAVVDAPKNPLPTSSNPANGIYFNIAIDSDYDGLLGTTSPTQGNLPNFSKSTVTTMDLTTGTSTAGVAVWANCNGSTTTTNPNFWVHTY